MILNKEQKIENDIVIENLLHDSSNVIKTSYNFNTNQLYVTYYKGGVYYYNGVTQDVYEKIYENDSIGSFMRKTIIPKYTAVKVGLMSENNLNTLKNEIKLLKENLDVEE